MNGRRRATTYLRTAMIAGALLLPTLSLIPLGSLWLWERGWLIPWVAASLLLTIAVYLLEAWMVRAQTSAAPEVARETVAGAIEQSWTPREAEAWKAVEAIAASADPKSITSRDAMLDLGLRTTEAVARSIHPGDKTPLWRFTVPEVLTLIERVSRDLKPFVADNVPLGDQLTIAQLMQIYRWRGAVEIAEQAHDLWRIVRMLNPVTAATNEAREQLTRRLYSGVRDALAIRLTQGFIREVGKAAIDLYGGRLRVSTEALAAHVSPETRRDLAVPVSSEPLRFLVAGQVSVGKSSLINALLADIKATVDVLPATQGLKAYELKMEAEAPVLLIDSGGITAEAGAIEQLVEAASACDLLIWVTPANRPDRAVDQKALAAVRSFFDARPDRRAPALLTVVTHVDQLRPFQEWSPPYDLSDAGNAKVRSMLAALEQVASDLAQPSERVVPVGLATGKAAYNVDGVWERINAVLPEATRAQLVRRLRGASGWRWDKLASQAWNAGKLATRTITGG